MKFFVSVVLMGVFALHAGSFRIILPENPKPWEKRAADDLQTVLSQSIRKGIFADNLPVEFHVGTTGLAKEQNWKLQDEEWRIKSIGNKIILCGGGTRGTVYASSIFQERFLGVRRWNMREQLIPIHDRELCLPPLDIQGRPEFLMRNIYPDSRSTQDNGRFAAFNRMNAYGDIGIMPEYGGTISFGSPYHVHTFRFYISEKEFFKDHPEYFALMGGKRNPHPIDGQLCLSNPALEKIFWEKLQYNILDDEAKAARTGLPAPAVYDLSQNDNNRVCSCDECSNIRKQYGNAEAGLQLMFLNKIARRLKAFRPGLKLSTLAYYQTEKLPAGIELEKNILIRLCNTANNYAGSILGDGEEPYRKKLSDWGKLAGSLFTWDYGVSFNRYGRGLPYPSEFFLQETLRYYRDNNVRYLFTEREHAHRSDMHTMKTWLHAKLMENPDADFKALLQDFLNGYYGNAAPFIGEYRQILFESVRKHHSFITAFMPPAIAFSHLDCTVVSRCDQLLQQAEDAVKNDPVLLRRVREARAGIDEAIVILIRKFNLEFPENRLDVQAARRRLMETVENSVRFYYRDKVRQGVIRDVAQNLSVYDFLPQKITPQEVVPGGIDIPIELSAWWWGGKDSLVPDSDSALGYAVKVLQKKPSVGCGAYDQQTRTSFYGAAIRAKDVSGPGYRWYRLPALKPRPAAYVYLTNSWFVQFPLSLAVAQNPDVRWNIRVSAKFTGPAYSHGKAGDENAVYIDRIVMEPTCD